MVFPEDVVKHAWFRANGRCECKRERCGHGYKCSRGLSWDHRGKETAYGWEAHHINSKGPDTLDNCEILCQPCHKTTQTFGG